MLNRIYNELFNHFGPQHWWPVVTNNAKLEVCIGAILTQNTAWSNVEKAINNLKNNNLININNLKNIKEKELAGLIKSSGYYNQKAKKLKNFINFVHNNYNSNINNFFDNKNLRHELLSIKGIGKETADSIMLYAAQKPVFVIDAYTKRIFFRLGFCKENISYDELQEFVHNNIKKNVEKYNEFHALLVVLGKEYCKKKPVCDGCPLRQDCKIGLSTV